MAIFTRALHIASGTHNATSKTTPVGADEIPLVDSEASRGLKKLTWTNLLAAVFSSPNFAEAAQDALALALAGTTGVTVTYNDVANTITVSGLGDSSATAETIRDAIGVALVGVGNVSVTVNDGLDTITISTTATVNSSDATLLARASHTGTQLAVTISDLLTDTDARDDLTTGESTMPRRTVNSQAVGSGNGNLRLAYFTARKTETITQLRSVTGAAAQVGATLCRTGVYSIDGSGDLTLIASIANDTTLWLAGATPYTRSLSASFSKVRGTRYAIGTLVVGTSTAPTFLGSSSLVSSEAGISPRLGGLVTGQTDLPSSVSAGSINDTANLAYVVLLP